MKKATILQQIEERISETENQLGGWADGIDGLIVEGGWECGCDREYPDFENGNYVCSLRMDDQWVADVVVDGGELDIVAIDAPRSRRWCGSGDDNEKNKL